MRDDEYRNYWNQNIDKWGELYLQASHGHEKLSGPRWLTGLYHATIARLEARLMQERFAITIAFLDRHVKRGSVFADIGSGTGIFTVEALKRGATVRAIDFSDKSLEITERNVRAHCPEGQVSYHRLNVEQDPIPPCDVAMAMGVTPYVGDLAAFLGNILPQTGLLYCQYTDPRRFSNRLRAWMPFLNVRRLIFHSSAEADRAYAAHAWRVRERRSFATGFIDLAGPG